MNPRTTRIIKEVRSLFWPWCVVTIAGVLSLVEQSYSALRVDDRLWGIRNLVDIWVPGFSLGIPLLAALSFGNEFRYRTHSLLLSQPISRMKIWGEKMSVMIAAILSAALVFCLAGRAAHLQDSELWVIAGAWISATIASATFWTLLARSTLGGVALNSVNCFIPLVWHIRPDWFPQTMPARSVAAFALLSYTGLMLWLGRRMFARFQVTGSMAGDDLLMAGPNLMPRALAGWLRSRDRGVVANLIRKELHLLRPVWLLSLLGVPVWIGLAAFGYTLERRSVPTLLMIVAFFPLIAVLAGSLSLGEERTSGTHAWHMTLPVPAHRQWLIKLLAAMFAGVVCPALLSILAMITDKFLSGDPFLFLKLNVGMGWLLSLALLSFCAFWCASTVNGTVRAALWVFPVMIAIVLSGAAGGWIAPKLVGFSVSRFDLFADFGFAKGVSNIRAIDAVMPPLGFALLMLAPMLIVAAVQSRRLFPKQLQDSPLFVVRRVVPLAATLFLWSFSLAGFDSFVHRAQAQIRTLYVETHRAIERLKPSTAKLDAAHPLQLTVEDLAAASPLSERTRHWLRDARITVSPYRAPAMNATATAMFFAPDQASLSYSAAIHLAGGSNCTVAFAGETGHGILHGGCE